MYLVEAYCDLFVCSCCLLYFSFYYRDGYAFHYPKECSDIVDSFAEYASNFTLCSIQHARPIRLCEKCVDQYVRFHNKYMELATTTINGTSCRSLYVSQDRLDAILEHHDNIQSIWNKGNCNCKYSVPMYTSWGLWNILKTLLTFSMLLLVQYWPNLIKQYNTFQQDVQFNYGLHCQ